MKRTLTALAGIATLSSVVPAYAAPPKADVMITEAQTKLTETEGGRASSARVRA